jgi:hypothetical protein
MIFRSIKKGYSIVVTDTKAEQDRRAHVFAQIQSSKVLFPGRSSQKA